MRAFEIGLAGFLLLGSFACSDEVDPQPEVGLVAFVSARPNLPLGQACKQQSTALIGRPPPTNVREEGISIPNGEDGARASCRVLPQGDGYAVSAQGTQDGSTFLLQGQVLSNGMGTLSTFVVSSSNTTPLTNRQPCTIRTNADPAKGERLRISPGEMFALISCPDMSDSDQPDTTQCAATGVLVLARNCAK